MGRTGGFDEVDVTAACRKLLAVSVKRIELTD